MTSNIVILDGGMGRELARMGAPFRQPEWSALALMEAPHFVRQAHDAFIAAGSQVITPIAMPWCHFTLVTMSSRSAVPS
jgi:S-methylmethionine-dependent homocysteine/selenocysteine methylase